MAWLQSLKVQGLRNLSQVEIPRFTQFNLFYGANGAGKTSLLEAIHLLGLGRSFRLSRHKPLIGIEADAAVAFGQVAGDFTEASTTRSIGVSRSRQGLSEIRVGGQRVNSSAELAKLLPLQVIHADTFQLILGVPGLRRQFMDWGVFHVEQGFLEQWRRMQRCLKQRNSLLRRGKIDKLYAGSWDVELVPLAESIADLRQHYFNLWLPVLLEMLNKLWPEGDELAISYYPGWDRELGYAEVLERQSARDRESGYTTIGPHKADLRFRVRGMPAGEILSRGQLKLLAAAMRLAQAAVLQADKKKRCIFLLDDLPSELDEERRTLLCRLLVELGSQAFVTSIERHGLANSEFSGQELSVFHVEHGSVAINGECG